MNRRPSRIYSRPLNQSFDCIRCHYPVSVEPLISRVRNRNHCPYCLWSKHVDLYKPGDRLSACKAGMKPIGVTLKRSNKKYGGWGAGELMLIHQCVDCGKVSINRLAADDDSQTILSVFTGFCDSADQLSAMLSEYDIRLLVRAEQEIVQRRLFG